jgi:hypothetical protein
VGKFNAVGCFSNRGGGYSRNPPHTVASAGLQHPPERFQRVPHCGVAQAARF